MYTTQQQIVLALLPKLSSSIGIICSLLLLSELIRDYRSGELNPIKRALVFVTIYEICDAIGWWISSWAIPYEIDFIWAIGSWRTCNFQGFLLQIAIGAPLCNSVLTFLFYIIVSGGWTVTHITCFEWTAYLSIFLFCFGTGFAFLALEQYNPTTQTCWIAGYPFGCIESIFHANLAIDDGESCQRGRYSYLYAIFGFYLILWCCFIIIICLNVSIRRLLLLTSFQNNNVADAEWIATQALLFGLAFIITWIPSTLWSIVTWFNISGFWLDIMSATLEPLQGFWNLFIFIRNRPDSIKRLKRMFGLHNYCCCCISLSLTRQPQQSLAFDFGLDGYSSSKDSSSKELSNKSNNSSSVRILETTVNRIDSITMDALQRLGYEESMQLEQLSSSSTSKSKSTHKPFTVRTSTTTSAKPGRQRQQHPRTEYYVDGTETKEEVSSTGQLSECDSE